MWSIGMPQSLPSRPRAARLDILPTAIGGKQLIPRQTSVCHSRNLQEARERGQNERSKLIFYVTFSAIPSVPPLLANRGIPVLPLCSLRPSTLSELSTECPFWPTPWKTPAALPRRS